MANGLNYLAESGAKFRLPSCPITYARPIYPASAIGTPPRARGEMRLSAKRRGARTVIEDLRTQGSLKALFPRTAGDQLDAVFLNTSGGLTGGDKMQIAVRAGQGTCLTVSSQAAERAYRAQPGPMAEMHVSMSAGVGAQLHWMPQETILFDGAALDRRLEVDLAEGATALLVEPLVFGRVAMGETVRDLRFLDNWRIRREGQLVFADAVRMFGDAQAHLAQAAIAAGAGALATIVLAGPKAAGFGKLDLPETCGASLLADDLLLIRLMAPDSFALRKILIPMVETLSSAPVPRVWRL